MRYLKIILILIFIIPESLFSLTDKEVFEKLKERFGNITTLKGTISISYSTGETYTGNFQYQPPGQVYIKFSNPPGKIIASNKKKLYVYDAATELCGIQELYYEDEEKDQELDEEEKKEKEEKINGGLENIFDLYKPALISEENEEYTLELINEKQKLKKISLNLDKTFFLLNAQFFENDETFYSVQLSNLKFDEKIMPGLFNFNVPANAQVVKNPLDIR